MTDKKNDNKKNDNKKTTEAISAIIVAVALLWYFFGGGLEKHAAATMHDIENTVAQEVVTQYNIAKQHGSPIDICLQAGIVSAAFLQAKDEKNYELWKSIETGDCQRAGLPQ